MNITDLFISGLIGKSRAIPEGVILQARKCLLDYMGVAVGGARFLHGQHPVFFESLSREKGDCSVLGTDFRTSAANAALLNGFSAHVLELDDGHRRGMIHLGASVISAILVVAEQEGWAIDRILRGIVLGYEAAVRCACALQPGHKIRGYHVSGTCGTIGAAIGVAFAGDFTVPQLKSTLSCSVTAAAGVLEIQEEASELKPFNPGRAALDGMMAARIGRTGLSGPDDILGGRRGLLAVLTDTPSPAFLTDFSGEVYCIEGIYQKLYAACRHSHPAIEAAIAIRNESNPNPEAIESVEIHTYKLAVGGHDHKQVKGISSAKLSTPFSVALGLVQGNAGPEVFNEATLCDPAILALSGKISVIEDAYFTAQSPAVRGARVVIRMNGGDMLEKTVLYPKGEPENPVNFWEIRQKALGLMGDYTANGYTEQILKTLWD